MDQLDIQGLDQVELELRKLAGVVAVGFSASPSALTAHLLVPDPAKIETARTGAAEIVRRHAEQPISVVVGPSEPRPRTGEAHLDEAPVLEGSAMTRVRLVGVTPIDDGAMIDIRLAHGQRQASACAVSGVPSAAAAATLDALDRLGWDLRFQVTSAVQLAVGLEGAVLVSLYGQGRRLLGVADSTGRLEVAVVRATLDALNRWISSQIDLPRT